MSPTKCYQLAVLPGEGIGAEVIAASLQVLAHVAALEGFTVDVHWGLIGQPAFDQQGSYFPDATAALCAQSDGILFGAVSHGGLLELRKHFDFFINLRPIQISDSLLTKSCLRYELVLGLDILVVRELVSGIYFGPAGRGESEQGPFGYHTMRYYDWEIRRIARVALQKAQARRGLLTVAHKENALPYIPWTRLVQEEALQYPNVTIEPMLIDNLLMQLIRAPAHFDVILAGNLFGDLLSDLGGAMTGSIGLLGSASLNAQGLGLYEPVHGTAPDIAGKGIANPAGMLMAMAMMLQQWGEDPAAQRVLQAQESIWAQGYRTADLNPTGAEKLVDTETYIHRLIQTL